MSIYKPHVPYEDPVTLGMVRPDVLHNVDDKYEIDFVEIVDKAVDIDDEWFMEREHLRRTRDTLGSPELLEALKPIGKVVADYVLQKHGVAPLQMEYMAFKRPVRPDTSQLGDGWHVDYAETRLKDTRRIREEVMVVSSAPDFTTEVLVREDDRDDRRQRRKTDQFLRKVGDYYVYSHAMQEAIDDGRFRVYQPKAYEAMLITKRFHRSPTNRTDQPIERSIVRAVARYDTKERGYKKS